MKKLVTLLAVLAATMTAAAADNPWCGTWKINLARSKLVDANGNEHPMDFRDSVVVIQCGDDQIKLVDDDTPTSGPATHFEWAGKFDGNDYPASGDANGSTYSYKPVSDRRQLLAIKKDGKVLAVRDLTLSADGNTRIMSGVMGNGTHIISVYEKQGVERSAKENPWFGTWILNVDKSKRISPDGTDLLKSVIVIQPIGDKIKVIDDDTRPAGKPAHFEWIGKFDGNDYPASGDAFGSTWSYKPIDEYTQLFAVKKDGKVLATRELKLSPDGKTRTMFGTRGNGTRVTAVYEKQ